MNILYLSHQSYFIFGGEVITMSLLRGLTQNHNVIFASPEGILQDRMKKYTDTLTIPSVQFSRKLQYVFPFLIAFFKTSWVLNQNIKNKKIQIVVTTSLKSFVYTLGLKIFSRNLKIYWHHQDILPHSFMNHMWLKFLSLFADKIIVLTEYSKKELMVSGVSPDKIFVNLLRVENTDQKNISTNDNFTICFMGEISSRKCSDQISLLVDHLRKTKPNFKFKILVAGSALSEPEFAKQVFEDNKKNIETGLVEFLGKVEKPLEVFSRSHVHCLLSRLEAAGRVILEAASVGVPTLAFPTGGIPEMMIDKKTGFLCKDLSEVAEKIIMLDQERALLESMSKDCKNFIKNSMSIEHMQTEFERIITQ